MSSLQFGGPDMSGFKICHMSEDKLQTLRADKNLVKIDNNSLTIHSLLDFSCKIPCTALTIN